MGLFDFFRKKKKEDSVLDLLTEAMSLMSEGGVDADELPNGKGEFGASPSNPIPTKSILGSNAYLGRLRTLDGKPVEHKRIGSFGSDVTPNPVDGYAIFSSDGQKLAT